jgi:hypothetical protein
LVVAGTVEDRVLELQEQKKSLIEGALDENAQRGIARLTAQDLGFLFVCSFPFHFPSSFEYILNKFYRALVRRPAHDLNTANHLRCDEFFTFFIDFFRLYEFAHLFHS